MNGPPPKSTLFPTPPLSQPGAVGGRRAQPGDRQPPAPLDDTPPQDRRRRRLRRAGAAGVWDGVDRKSTRLNSSHANISYAVFCLKKKKNNIIQCIVENTL